MPSADKQPMYGNNLPESGILTFAAKLFSITYPLTWGVITPPPSLEREKIGSQSAILNFRGRQMLDNVGIVTSLSSVVERAGVAFGISLMSHSVPVM